MKKRIRKLVVLALAVGMLATSILGASAAFDPAYYAAQNPDVVKALGNAPEMLKLHYDMFGKKEARMSNANDVEAQLRRLFNEKEYAKLYPDVEKAFGVDKELMFQHYIAFGLLEGRRPSEKVSQAAAASMKQSVEKAMKDAGLAATPGTAEVVAVITGETSNVASAGGAAVQQALTQVAAVVAKEVTATVKEINKPTPAPAPESKPSSTGTNIVKTSYDKTYKTAYLAVYTDVETKKTGDVWDIISLAGGQSVRTDYRSDKYESGDGVTVEIPLSAKNRIDENDEATVDFWYAVAVPKAAVSTNDISPNNLKLWYGSISATGNRKTVQENYGDSDSYLICLGDYGDGGDTTFSLGTKDDDKVTFKINVKFVPTVTVYDAGTTATVSENDGFNTVPEGAGADIKAVTGLKNPRTLTCTGGTGTESSPFTFAQIDMSNAAQIDEKPWIAIDLGIGTVIKKKGEGDQYKLTTITTGDVNSGYLTLTDEGLREKLVAFNDDGKGGDTVVQVKVGSSKNLFFKFNIKPLPAQSESAEE